VVVGWSGSKPFRWTESGGMQPLGNPSWGNAWGVSADGTVVTGQASIDLVYQAFRWTQATGLVGLGTLPGYSGSQAFAISADGATIVGSVYGGPDETAQPMRWTEVHGMVGLGNPPGCDSGRAMGVSGDGAVIIGECWIEVDEIPTRIAFVWTAETGTRTVQDFLIQRGVVLDEPLAEPDVRAVSDDGRVIAVVESTPEILRTRLIEISPTAVPTLPSLWALGLAAALLYIGMRSSSSRAT
jgi:probable HAF family extracellular repeat protein